MSCRELTGIPDISDPLNQDFQGETSKEVLEQQVEDLEAAVRYYQGWLAKLDRRISELTATPDGWRSRCLRAEHKCEEYLDIIRDLRQGRP